jgi:hypothetical protein
LPTFLSLPTTLLTPRLRTITSLDGLYLTNTPSSNNNNDNTTTLGVYSNPSTPSTPQIKFHPVYNPDTKLWELHTAGETTLAVLGANGVLDFASLSDPEATTETLPEGTLLDWTSFSLGEEADGGVVDYAGTEGRWVAFPTSHDPGAVVGGEGDGEMGWSVKWRNSESFFSFLLSSFYCCCWGGGVEETAD